MTRKDDSLDKSLRRHLGLFGASAAQLTASRERVRERLRQQAPDSAGMRPDAAPSPRVQVWWRLAVPLAAAAAVILLVAISPRDRVESPERPTPFHAAIATLDGVAIAEGVLVQSTADGAMLTLADGSRVEMRAASALSLERKADGIGIRLRDGSIIVNAAPQRGGHLYVHTKDVDVTVVGTVFLVNAEAEGSRVGVIEGEVRVRDGASETRLRPGEQVATSAALAIRPLHEALGWSRNAPAHLAILASFTTAVAATAGPLAPLRPSVQAQGGAPAARREFEAASIAPCDPDNIPPPPEGARGGGANSFQMTPGRAYALCMTLATLIRTAYGYGPVDLEFLQADGRGRGMQFDNVYGLGVEDGRRVRGGPDWVRSERFTVVATAGAPVDPEIMRGPMLRDLLARRFQLKLHVEQESVPAFALKVAPGGLRITPVGDDACVPRQPNPNGPQPPMPIEAIRRGQKPPCGLGGQRNGPNSVLIAGAAPLRTLAGVLGSAVGRVRVIDRTGITDRFNFVFEYLPDGSAPGQGALPPGPPLAEVSDVEPAAPLRTALEEQLGLRLEPDKGVREFIVIDSVERLSPN